MSDCLTAALDYANRGWPVLPLHTPRDGACDCHGTAKRPGGKECPKPGKHPRTEHGIDAASLDEQTIRRWWDIWPHANVGVSLKPAGLLDVAPDSIQYHAEFVARGLPDTPRFQSGGGDGHEHYLYRLPEGAPNHRICKEDEYDLMSHGLAVMPPSLHQSGRLYRWLAQPPLANAPGWSVQMLHQAVQRNSTVRNGVQTEGEPPVRLSGDALERWDGRLFDARADGTVDRSKSLWQLGCALADGGATRSTLLRVLPERDEALGWAKYLGRSDEGERYEVLVDRVLSSKAPTLQRPAASNGHHQGGQLAVVRMSEVQPEPIQWLWRGRFARGKATLLIGDPGLGKSLITHWMSALISTGGTWPDGGQCEQGAAILFTIEDGLADTVAPRLLVAGANMNRVVAVRGVLGKDDSLDARMFELTQHLELLDELIQQEKASLVVMDPVTAYLGPDVNSHKESDVRAVLGPLQLLAERTGITLAMLMHLNKGSGVSALYRAIGSIAFPAVARVVLGVAPDPNDEEGKRRLMLPVKMNIGQLPSGIGYRIETASHQGVLRTADAADQPPRLVWDNDPVTIDAASAMDRSGSAQEMGALEEAKSALLQILANGHVLASEGKRQIKDSVGGVSEATLIRARKELGIRVRKEGYQGAWWWEPPIIPQNSIKDSLEALQPMQPLEAPKGYIDSNGSNESLRAPAREAVQSMDGGVVSISTGDEAMPGGHRCRICRGRLFPDEQEVCERCQ